MDTDQIDMLYGSAPCKLRIQKKMAIKAAKELFYEPEIEEKINAAETVEAVNRVMRAARSTNYERLELIFGKKDPK